MSYRRERIDKEIDTALACQARMLSARRFDVRGEDLTAGISAARRAIERLNSYCEKEDKLDLKAEFHARRTTDPLATYAWEMRNADEHDVDGATRARPNRLKATQIDRSKLGHIKKLSLFGTRILSSDTDNVSFEHLRGGLEIGPIFKKNGPEIEKPADATPETLLKALIDVAVSYRDKVQPR